VESVADAGSGGLGRARDLYGEGSAGRGKEEVKVRLARGNDASDARGRDAEWSPRAERYACEGVECQARKFANLICQAVGEEFCMFCQIFKDANLICKTVGVALRAVFVKISIINTHSPFFILFSNENKIS